VAPTSLKNLGITLYKNGTGTRAVKYIANHASQSLFNLFKVLNHPEFSFEKKTDERESPQEA